MGGVKYIVKKGAKAVARPVERALGHRRGHDNDEGAAQPVPVVPVPDVPPETVILERVPQLEQQVTGLEEKLVNESARADGATQELGAVKQELEV